MVNYPQLSPEHLKMLKEESGISDAVIQARGYKTIPNVAEGLAELEAKGFAPTQCRAPGLLIPLHTTDGGNGLYVYRPDNPRVSENRKRKNADGTHPQKVIKYEQPKGEPIRLDCPPTCQHLLADLAIPLFITEGQKKGDALASRGACVVVLTGVWNFKGTNKFGGKTFLADWDYVALNGRWSQGWSDIAAHYWQQCRRTWCEQARRRRFSAKALTFSDVKVAPASENSSEPSSPPPRSPYRPAPDHPWRLGLWPSRESWRWN